MAQKIFYPFEIKESDAPNSITFKDTFSFNECSTIIDLFKDNTVATIGSGSVSQRIRDSHLHWIELNDDSRWIYERLEKFVLEANNVFKLDLWGFSEKIQLTKYAINQHYDWHKDSGMHKSSVRKLSIVVNLTDPNKYEGGTLEFFGKENRDMIKDQGSMILFPSYLYHRVHAVTSGTRYSLVMWVSGRPYV